jgi:hypothetical protein
MRSICTREASHFRRPRYSARVTDFPAAHSMDTAWFAIDNDGNVALFETGESGAVPEEAYTDDAYSMQDEVRALPSNGFKFDPQGYAETRWSDHAIDPDEEADADTEVFMFLTDTVPTQDLLARLDAEEMQATQGKCFRLKLRDRAAYAELHARAACAGCYRDYGEREEDLASHGIYRYSHTCENWIAGPYARSTVPAKPLAIDDIPASIKKIAVAFDGRFADTQKLQPAEHWSCSSWEAGWLSSDGKTARPFPDHEDSWDDYSGDRSDVGDGGIEFLDEPLAPKKKPKKRWWK